MHTLFSRGWRIVLGTMTTGLFVVLSVLPAAAASTVSVNTFNLPNGGFPGTPIKASSAPAAILKLEVTASQTSQTFTSVTVNFSGAGFVTTTSLAAIATGASSGVALYLDDGGTAAQFDGTDSVITLAASPNWTGNTNSITLTPATPVTLVSGTAKIFYVVIRTASTINNGDQIIASVSTNGVVTSDGSGPTASFSANNYTGDTQAPTITKVDGATGSNSLTVTFSEPVQKVGGGNLTASDFTYVDGGGSAQTISSVSQTAGQSTAILTMSGNLDSQDFSVPATLAAGSNKIADMAANAAGTGAVNATSSVKITTATVPSATAGTVYSGSPLVTFAASGGAGSFTWAFADASSTATFATLGLNLNTNTGAVTGTVANVSGAFNFNLKVTDAAFVTSTKGFTINVAPVGGGGVPGITNVNPPGGTQGATNYQVTVTGSNTNFANNSAVDFLMPQGLTGINGITVSNVSASSTTVLNFLVTISASSVMGSRDIKITTGGESVIFPNGFGVGASGGSGLTLMFPSANATGVPIPPGFNFIQTSQSSVLSYRITVKAAQDLNGTVPALWDYVFPQNPSTSGGHCQATNCNLSYGAGVFRILTQASALAPNTDYYWQIRTYTTTTGGVSDTLAPLEATPQRKFTTTASITDTTPPSIFHRPVFQGTASTNLDIFARILDNVATASSTPALTAKILYCAGSGCTPANPTNGVSIGAGYYRFTIPSGTISTAGTVIRYSLQSSDGANTTNFQQPGSVPFQLTSVAAGTNTITGSVKDGTATCAATVQGAIVFAEGSGFSAMSNGSCNFTLSNIFAGTYDLVAVHDGYADRKIEGVSGGSTAIAFSIPLGQSGGFGGDTAKPRIKFTGPMDGMTNMPGGFNGFKVFLVFDKTMSQNAVTTAGNLKVQELNPSTGALTDITTTKGSWTYYPTAPGTGTMLPNEANMAAWSLSGTNTLGDNKTFVVQVSQNITDTAGNPIQGNQPDGSYAFSFSTGQAFTGTFTGGGSFGGGAFIPPRVNGMTPPPGMVGVPLNSKMVINFSDAMGDDSGVYTLKSMIKLFRVSGTTETDISSSAISTVTLDTTKLGATVTLSGSFNGGLFESNTQYRLKVLGGAKSGASLTLAPPGSETQVMFMSSFTAGSTSDTAAPTVVGSFPDSNATNMPVNMGAVSVGFNKDLDSSTVTTNSVYLSIGSTNVNGTVQYRPLERQVLFIPKSALNPNTTYTFNVTTDVKALNGVAIATAVARTFTTGAANTTPPSITFINADDFNLAITLNEPVNSAKAVDTLNSPSSILNPSVYGTIKYGTAGFNPASAGTTISLTAATFTYDPVNSTVVIGGLALPPAAIGQEIYVSLQTATAANLLKDLSGVTTTGSNARATIKNSQNTKGALGPMAMTTSAFSSGGSFVPQNFSSASFGFAPSVEVRPFNTLAGQTTVYGIRLPISKQIPASGAILLTFPSGFDVSNAKQDVNSPMRADLNGPGTGTITYKCATNVAGGKACAGTSNADDTGAAQGGLADDGIVVNTAARTITVYLSAATNVEGHDFLNLDIAGIKNSTVPKDFNTSGYTVDIKSLNGSTQLESFTSSPVFIQSAGTNVLTGTITATSNDQAGTAKVYLVSPITGPLETTSVDFASGTTATYTFNNIPAGTYQLFTDQAITLFTKEYAGKNPPDSVVVGSGTTTYNFTVSSNTSGGTNVTVNVTGPASESLDVFAGSPTGFRRKQVTLNGGGTGSVTLNLASGNWSVGVGPQMPTGITTGGPPPAPTTYTMPKPKQINITGATTCTIDGANGCTAAFTLTSASKTIKGLVQDGSGKVMANVEVYAYSPTGGFGTHAETDSVGAFTLNVSEGSYVVGSFVPGMPPSREVPVTVSSAASAYLFISGATTGITPAAAASSFIIKIAKPDYTISGKVTDGTSVVQGASVYAYRTDGAGHAAANTDAKGAYTLYVTNGTWKVGTFLPQYGNLTEQSVTVSGSSQSNIDFSPTLTGTFYTVSGRLYQDTDGSGTFNGGDTAIQGAFVRIVGNGTANQVITSSDGTYSFNVPSGNGYVLRGFAPSVGELPPTASFNITANVSNKDIAIGALSTLTVKTSVTVSDAFINFQSGSGQTASAIIKNGTSTTVQLPNGNYKINVNVPGTSIAASAIAATTGATVLDQANSIVTVDGTEGLTVTIPTLRSVTGTVTDGTSAVGSAWVDIMLPGSSVHFGTQAASDGTFSLQVADSATSYKLNAMKPGYVRQPSSLTVNGANAGGQTLAMTSASLTITGQVLIGSSGAANAFVRAEKQGGGFAGTQADANGNYSLSVTAGTWSVFAVAEGYAEAGLSTNPLPVTASVSSKNITLSTTVSLNAPKTQPITPSSGGTLEDSTSGVKLTIPANALGSDTSAGNIESKDTNNVRGTSAAKPVGGKAKDIKATDSSGNPITTLNSSVTVDLTYTKADLATTASASDSSINTKAEVDKLQMGYWDETTSNWVSLASTITYLSSTGTVVTVPASDLSNVSSVQISANTTHFSLYAPIVATDPSALDVPTGFTANGASTSQVSLAWTAVSSATGYDIYRSTSADGTFSRVGSEPTVSSGSTVTYSDTGLSSGTVYFYKMTSLNGSVESTSTSAVSASTGGASTVTTGGGGGGGGGSLAPVNSTYQTLTTTASGTTSTTVTTSTTGVSPAPAAPAPAGTSPAPAAAAPGLTQTLTAPLAIQFKGLVSATPVVAPGAKLNFQYDYLNNTGKKQSVTIVRQIVNAKGKVVVSSRTQATVQPGKAFKGKVSQAITKSLPSGTYEMKVMVTGTKASKVKETSQFSFTVEKPQPKAKTEKPKAEKTKAEKPKGKTWTVGSATGSEDLSFSSVLNHGKFPAQLALRFHVALDETTKVNYTLALKSADGKIVSSSKGSHSVNPKAGLTVTQGLSKTLAVGSYQIILSAESVSGEDITVDLGQVTIPLTVSEE